MRAHVYKGYGYYIKRDTYLIILEVNNPNIDSIYRFELTIFDLPLLLYLFGSDEAKMIRLYKLAHKRAKQIIDTDIKYNTP